MPLILFRQFPLFVLQLPPAAFITVLSVNNGFKVLFKTRFSVMDPDLKITPKEGKTFIAASAFFNKLTKIEGIEACSKTLEENVLLKYEDRQYIATLKGVDNSYTKVNRIDTTVKDGEFILKSGITDYAVLGKEIAMEFLQINLNGIHPIQVTVLRKDATISLNPQNALNQDYIFPKGFFTILPEVDVKYMITSLDFASHLLEDTLSISSLEIKVKTGYKTDDIKEKISKVIGKAFYIKDRYEQKEQFFRILNYEKWIIFFILTFIFIIASFNIIGSLAV
jgi:lipoprotein-releasing system permease protein